MTVRSPHRRPAALAAMVVLVAALVTATGPAGATPTGGGWEVVSPGDVGLDPAGLEQARAYAFEPAHNTQGVVVVRAGRIAAEWYADGEGPRSWAASWSMAKSITSILIGIAIDDGLIAGVDEPMATWFPDWQGTPKAAITLRNVLQMESGLESNEDYDPANIDESTVITMGLSADQLAYSAARPLVTTPGTEFNYSSADTMLLSRVLRVATGEPVADYAQRKLFEPLGISQIEWWSDAAGNTLTYCCVDTPTRNFARIGWLYANDGNWNGDQIVSADWVHESLTPTVASDGNYGYQWWLTSLPDVDGPIAMMNGFDGQFVYVIPELELVVARNGDYTKSACPPVADPNLFGRYPPLGLSDDAGTRPPDEWDPSAFLDPIIEAVTGPAGAVTFPAREPPPPSRAPDGQAMTPCVVPEPPGPPERSAPEPPEPPEPPERPPAGTAAPAAPVAATPRFTG